MLAQTLPEFAGRPALLVAEYTGPLPVGDQSPRWRLRCRQRLRLFRCLGRQDRLPFTEAKAGAGGPVSALHFDAVTTVACTDAGVTVWSTREARVLRVLVPSKNFKPPSISFAYRALHCAPDAAAVAAAAASADSLGSSLGSGSEPATLVRSVHAVGAVDSARSCQVYTWSGSADGRLLSSVGIDFRAADAEPVRCVYALSESRVAIAFGVSDPRCIRFVCLTAVFVLTVQAGDAFEVQLWQYATDCESASVSASACASGPRLLCCVRVPARADEYAEVHGLQFDSQRLVACSALRRAIWVWDISGVGVSVAGAGDSRGDSKAESKGDSKGASPRASAAPSAPLIRAIEDEAAGWPRLLHLTERGALLSAGNALAHTVDGQVALWQLPLHAGAGAGSAAAVRTVEATSALTDLPMPEGKVTRPSYLASLCCDQDIVVAAAPDRIHLCRVLPPSKVPKAGPLSPRPKSPPAAAAAVAAPPSIAAAMSLGGGGGAADAAAGSAGAAGESKSVTLPPSPPRLECVPFARSPLRVETVSPAERLLAAARSLLLPRLAQPPPLPAVTCVRFSAELGLLVCGLGNGGLLIYDLAPPSEAEAAAAEARQAREAKEARAMASGARTSAPVEAAPVAVEVAVVTRVL